MISPDNLSEQCLEVRKEVVHMQIGDFSLSQRFTTVLYRGAQFFAVGFASSAVGHSLTKWGVRLSFF